MVFGHNHPTNAPAGHGEILGKRIDDIAVVRQFQRSDRLLFIFNSVIDLVRDERGARFSAGPHQITHRRVIQHRTRGVGRGCNQQPRQIHPCKIGGDRLIAVGRLGGQIDGFQCKCFQNLAVAGIAGRADAHFVTSVEQRGERQNETTR